MCYLKRGTADHLNELKQMDGGAAATCWHGEAIWDGNGSGNGFSHKETDVYQTDGGCSLKVFSK